MTLKKLQLFFIFYLLFIVVITAIFYFSIYNSTTVQEEDTQNIFYGVSAIFSLSALGVGNVLFNKFKSDALINVDVSQQEQIYARGSIIRFAMIEGALIYNIIIAFVMNLIPLLYIVAALFLYIITLFPSNDKYKRDMNKF